MQQLDMPTTANLPALELDVLDLAAFAEESEDDFESGLFQQDDISDNAAAASAVTAQGAGEPLAPLAPAEGMAPWPIPAPTNPQSRDTPTIVTPRQCTSQDPAPVRAGMPPQPRQLHYQSWAHRTATILPSQTTAISPMAWANLFNFDLAATPNTQT
mmetsp:Transcript_8707/g.23512  ORF Transcript_8707/g.23512 Transcript_8707/m.23512 type:complete len:157 (+) Transcript_8707:1061-1531(+)